MNIRKTVCLWLVAVLAVGAGTLTALTAAPFNGAADYYFDSLGYYYVMTGGQFPNGQTVNGDNASGGTMRFLLDEPAWGSYPIDVWNKDDWFPQNAGLAVTLSNGGSTVFDNFNNAGGDFYTCTGGVSAATPGLYRGYSMSNNWDWIYAGYFKLSAPTTLDKITGYFDENSGFDRNSPHIGYRINIWSDAGGGVLLPAVASFTGDVVSSDTNPGSFAWGDTGVDRVFCADYGNITDDIFYLSYELDTPVTLPPGEYWFSHDAIVTTPIVVSPTAVIAGDPVDLSAVVSLDAGDLQTACYTVDGGPENPLNIDNNPYGYDALTSATFSVPDAGDHEICAFGKDGLGNPGPEVCTTLTVYAACDNPDPLSQGYWHRQCLGVPASEGGIDPGRNGRGPEEPLIPDFDKLMSEIEPALEPVGAYAACADGMDANPASDPCERAIKQYTALLFNEAYGLVQMGCDVDLSALGCSSTNVLELIDELAALIAGGQCDVAADCAAAVNGGGGIVEAALIGPETPAPAAPETAVVTAARPTGPDVRFEAEVRPRADRAPATPPVPAPVEETAMVPSALTVVQPLVLDREPAVEPVVEASAPETDLEAIQRHLASLGSAEDGDAAVDALLTALSGGYEPELRLEIARALADRVDVSYRSLLADHVRDILDEATAFEKEELAGAARKLLKHLEADR